MIHVGLCIVVLLVNITIIKYPIFQIHEIIKDIVHVINTY